MADDDAKDKPGTGKPGGDEDAAKLREQAEVWKRRAREWEEKAKANSDAADRLKKLEDADKSEIDKARAAQTEAEKERDSAKAELLRLTVASEKGLTPAQARRLVGSTREELETDADELLETFGGAKGGGGGEDKEKPTPRSSPRERLSGGGDPTEEPEETDPRKLAAMVPRR